MSRMVDPWSTCRRGAVGCEALFFEFDWCDDLLGHVERVELVWVERVPSDVAVRVCLESCAGVSVPDQEQDQVAPVR